MRVARETTAEAERQGVVLQLCEWHAVQAFRRKLVTCSYKKKEREEIDDLLWIWVKSSDPEALRKNRAEVLSILRTQDQGYLKETYQQKERQFIRAYTKHLPNLRCHSTQRGEKNHHVTKEKGLNRHLRLADAVRILISQDADLGDRIRQKENRERDRIPRSLSLTGNTFQDIRSAVTNYTLNLIMPEWAAAKTAAATTPEKEVEEQEEGCSSQCENPERYRLPCRHWLLRAAVTGTPIPQSLIHPRWFYDEPAVPRGCWCMSLTAPAPAAGQPPFPPPMVATEEDPHRQHGAPMLKATLLEAQEL